MAEIVPRGERDICQWTKLFLCSHPTNEIIGDKEPLRLLAMIYTFVHRTALIPQLPRENNCLHAQIPSHTLHCLFFDERLDARFHCRFQRFELLFLDLMCLIQYSEQKPWDRRSGIVNVH